MLLSKPVITGTGIICAAGRGVNSVWDAVQTGHSGLGPLTLFSSPRYASHLVGQVRHDVNALAGHVHGSRSDKLIWIAAQEALLHSGLISGLGALRPERVGVAIGCTVGGMLGTEQVLAGVLRIQRRRFGPLRFHECANAADVCAELLGARGPCVTFSTACSAAAMAIAAAAEWIEQGETDVVLAGGGDSLCRMTLNGFGSLLLLDPNGCRPFDAQRAGISLGEGAAMLVLEAEATARARGAPMIGRLAGWGASCDAWHATAPQPEGDGALAAMQRALQRAGLTPADIDYVSAHGTGTPDNDAMESRALQRLFGEALPPVASVKRFFGHTLAASGAIKAVVCLEALRHQMLPPNLGFERPDPRIGLEPVRQFQPQPLHHVLSNSFGFGGNNAALVFSRVETNAGRESATADPDQEEIANRKSLMADGPSPIANGPASAAELSEPISKPRSSRRQEAQMSTKPEPPDVGCHHFAIGAPASAVGDQGVVLRQPARLEAAMRPAGRPVRFAIVGVGAISAAGSTLEEIQTAFRKGGAVPVSAEVPAATPPGHVPVYACGAFGAEQAIGTVKRRKLNRLQQMVLVAARQSAPSAIRHPPSAISERVSAERTCVAVGTGFGSLNDTAAFVENMIRQEERAPRPLFFSNSVHNALASQLAIELKLTGLNATPIQREIAFESALWHGTTEIALGHADQAVVGAADELNPFLLATGMRWGWWHEQSPPLRPFTSPLTGRQRPLPGEGAAVFRLAAANLARDPLAWVSGIRLGRWASQPNDALDAAAEARWIAESLEREGQSVRDVDMLLTGANGWPWLDRKYRAVADALAERVGRPIAVGAYKQCCGEHHAASAFGLFTALGLVRGEIPVENCARRPSDRPCRCVVVLTLAPTGTKGMCCVCA